MTIAWKVSHILGTVDTEWLWCWHTRSTVYYIVSAPPPCQKAGFSRVRLLYLFGNIEVSATRSNNYYLFWAQKPAAINTKIPQLLLVVDRFSCCAFPDTSIPLKNEPIHSTEPLLEVIREQGECPFRHKEAGSKDQNSQGSKERDNCNQAAGSTFFCH